MRNILPILIICLLLFSGCVRFTDSRASLIREDDFDPSAQYVGVDAFYRYEREQRARLSELINSRLANISGMENSDYRIGPGDKISLFVMNFEEVSKEYRVGPDGAVNLPYVGKIQVKGKTESQVSSIVKKRLSGFVVDPIITVEVSDYSAHRVWVVRGDSRGTGQNNGQEYRNSFPLNRPLFPLIELLMEVGNIDFTQGGVVYLYPKATRLDAKIAGRTQELQQRTNPFCFESRLDTSKNPVSENASSNCNKDSARIETRYSENSRIQIDLEELLGGATGNPLYVPLEPGDVIVVPPTPTIQVYGEVFARGGFRVSGGRQDAGSVSKPSLMSIISAARGFTYSADIHQIEIYRELEFGKKVVLEVDFEKLVLKQTQDIRLRDGDVVWVPSHKSRFYEEHSIRAINALLGTSSGVQRAVE